MHLMLGCISFFLPFASRLSPFASNLSPLAYS